jgi:DNA-binding response OmpR family regulator
MEAHILVVEDDHDALRKIAYRLQYAGYRVTQAASGEQALELLKTSSFEVVLTDIVMDQVDGLTVMHAARQTNYRPAVVLLTGHGSLESCMDALRAGAYDYLLKPCSPEKLLTCIEGAVQRHTAEHQLRRVAHILAGQPLHEVDSGVNSMGIPNSTETASPLSVGRLLVGHSRYDVWFNEQQIKVTPIEYTLLRYLAERTGASCSCSDIVQYTHGLTVDEGDAHALVKSHIQNLRKKIGREYLVKGEGRSYKLVVPETVNVGSMS